MLPLKKKGFIASVAALAMAVGGLGIGAGVANAEEATAPGDIVLTNAQKGHTYNIYKIGDYASVVAGTAEDTANSVAGVDGSLAVVKASGEANTAVHNAADGADGTEGDSVAWASRLESGSAQLRKLVGDINATGLTEAAGSPVTATSTDDIKLNLPLGWYLIKDTYKDANNDTQNGVGALVGTVAGTEDAPITKIINAKGDTLFTLGTVDVKSEDTDEPGKNDADPKKTYSGSLAVADGNAQNDKTVANTPEFTLTAKGPTFSPTITYKSYDYQFIDTPSGLSINTADIKATVKSTPVTPKILVEQTDEATGEVTLVDAPATVTGKFYIDLSDYFTGVAKTVTADNADSLSKQPIVVTYKATVTGKNDAGDAVDVSNSFDINDNGHKIPGDEVTPEDGVTDVSFKKVGVGDDSEALANAEFQLQAADGTVLATATSTEAGVVDFKAVAPGEYKLVESNPPAGYTVAPKLDALTVKVTAKTETEAAKAEFADGNDTKMLTVNSTVADDSGAAATLLNVQNLAQLPLTGAYGIFLFIVLAAVLAGGAAVMVTVSKRNQKAGLAL